MVGRHLDGWLLDRPPTPPMPPPTLRPRSAGEIVDAAFQILRAHYGQFVICSALAYSPLLVLRVFVLREAGQVVTATGSDVQAWGFVVTSGTALLVGWLTFSLMSAVLLVCASQAYLGEEVDVAAGLRRALPRLPRVLVAAVLRYVMMFVSMFALVLPVLYVIARFFAVTPAIVLEGAGLGQSFSRSSALSRGRKRHVLNTLALVGLIYWILVVGITVAVSMFGSFLVSTLASAVVTVLLYPVVAITEALLYYDARIQSEGLDIELMTGALAPPATTLSTP
jgi:hypothetical protein